MKIIETFIDEGPTMKASSCKRHMVIFHMHHRRRRKKHSFRHATRKMAYDMNLHVRMEAAKPWAVKLFSTLKGREQMSTILAHIRLQIPEETRTNFEVHPKEIISPMSSLYVDGILYLHPTVLEELKRDGDIFSFNDMGIVALRPMPELKDFPPIRWFDDIPPFKRRGETWAIENGFFIPSFDGPLSSAKGGKSTPPDGQYYSGGFPGKEVIEAERKLTKERNLIFYGFGKDSKIFPEMPYMPTVGMPEVISPFLNDWAVTDDTKKRINFDDLADVYKKMNDIMPAQQRFLDEASHKTCNEEWLKEHRERLIDEHLHEDSISRLRTIDITKNPNDDNTERG